MAKKPISIEALKHDATRRNIPTAEFESIMREEDKSPVQVAYERRNRDLDPQLVWRGKDEQDWSDLIVHGWTVDGQIEVQAAVCGRLRPDPNCRWNWVNASGLDASALA